MILIKVVIHWYIAYMYYISLSNNSDILQPYKEEPEFPPNYHTSKIFDWNCMKTVGVVAFW